MTDKSSEAEAVAWILRSPAGHVRLWTQSAATAVVQCIEWNCQSESLFPASSLASRDARIADLEALLEEAVKGLEPVALFGDILSRSYKDTPTPDRVTMPGQEPLTGPYAELVCELVTTGIAVSEAARATLTTIREA